MRTLLFLNELESDFTIIVFQTSHVSTSEVVAFNLCTLTDSKSYTKIMIKYFFLGENTELTSRLQTVRQKAVELEKNLANVTASCDKYQEVNACVSLNTVEDSIPHH